MSELDRRLIIEIKTFEGQTMWSEVTDLTEGNFKDLKSNIRNIVKEMEQENENERQSGS